MIYGLYLSAQGAEAQTMRQAVLANNLANAQTTAFKRDIPVFRCHWPFDAAEQTPFVTPPGIEDQTGGVTLSGTAIDFSQGPLEVTNRELDVAIMGPGFLEIDTGVEKLLTRDGKLTLGPNGVLVTADQGHPVLDTSGQPIVIPEGTQQLAIAHDGLLSGMTTAGVREILGQLGVVEPRDLSQMTKVGNGFYRPLRGVDPAVRSQLRQGVLEGSGTNPVHGMVELIETSRSFEMNMNLIQYQDDMLGKLIASSGKN